MSDDDGLLCAYLLDGDGGGQLVGWDAIHSHNNDSLTLWVHLDRKQQQSQQWLEQDAGLEAHVCEAMLEEVTRPRIERFKDGVLLILRGVNLNVGADPEDMISVRLWVEPKRIISLRYPRLQAVQALRDSLDVKKGPCGSGDFIVQLVDGLTDRMDPVIDDLEVQIEEFETVAIDPSSHPDVSLLSELRRRAITLRRYIAPQREVVSRLQVEPLSWLDEVSRAQLRESSDQIRRYVEDLDLAYEHALIIQDQLQHRMSEQMNRTMYLVSIIAAIFLPLGLLTGLLGINVGGMPGAHNSVAFWVVCIILLVLAYIQIWVFRRMNFF
ncbi:MAG: zinc transporter ZntB [Candidatus Hinthialibacter antarcticus]|nr:zinc transporter ZntB [Candidatus Hinthialibacter antarcticus]